MLALPNLPTENLYKFLALGGIIITITSVLYFLTENQKISVDTVKLKAKAKAYWLTVDSYNEETARIKAAFIRDSSRIAKEFVSLDSDSRYMKTHKGHVIVYYDIDGKKSFIDEHRKDLYTRLRLVTRIFNNGISKENNRTANSDLDKIKVEEQRELIEANQQYLYFLEAASVGVCVVGVFSSFYGFRKWQENQFISDELGNIQLAKAKKELDDLSNKKKIIL
jgi:hypothetical protein